MITGWSIYWITRLDAIGIFILVLWLVPLIAGIIGFTTFGLSISDDHESERRTKKWTTWKTYFAWWISSVLTLGLLFTLLPSTKEYAAIWLIPKVANNEQVSKVPEQALKLLNLKVEEWINGMTGEKEMKK